MVQSSRHSQTHDKRAKRLRAHGAEHRRCIASVIKQAEEFEAALADYYRFHECLGALGDRPFGDPVHLPFQHNAGLRAFRDAAQTRGFVS